MSYLPYYTRRFPVNVTEMILPPPRAITRGGNGWASAMITATANGATTTFIADPATTGLNWSDFETGAHAVDDRFLGSTLIINGKLAYITDYAGATGTFTITPAAGNAAFTTAETATGKIAFIQSDIPLTISKLLIKTAGVNLRFNTRKSGLIAAGVFEELLNGEAALVIDESYGAPGRPLFILATAPGFMDIEVAVP